MAKRSEYLFMRQDGSLFIISITGSKRKIKVFLEDKFNELESLTPQLYLMCLREMTYAGKVIFITKL